MSNHPENRYVMGWVFFFPIVTDNNNKVYEETGKLSPTEGTNSPENNTKEIEIYELPDKKIQGNHLMEVKYFKTIQIDN